MPRSYLIYLEDILTSTSRILGYVSESSFEEFINDEMRLDAVERNFILMGEAVKNVPQEIKQKYSFIEWGKMADFRNVLAHEYFGVSKTIMWTIIKEKLPRLKEDIRNVLKQEKDQRGEVKSSL